MVTSRICSTKGSMALVVITREGKRYNLGRQMERGRLSRWLQNLRIAYYRWDRARRITDQSERAEFLQECAALKRALTARAGERKT